MSRLLAAGRAAGVTGALLGLAAAGAAVGLAAERYAVGRSLRGRDPFADEPFGSLRGDPLVVPAADGVELYAEVDDPGGAGSDLTVVFSHGYALNLDVWHFQRRDLRGSARLVFWDQRSHGRSGRAPEGSVSFERLADDLGGVLDAAAPTGPVLLVGHSMGGMTVMDLLVRRPELLGRVVGIAFVASSAGGLREVTLGVPGPAGRLAGRLAPGVVSALARQPDLVERGRRAGSDLGFVLTKRYSFADDAPASLVEFTAQLNAGTPIGVVAEFLPVFATHDQRERLGLLSGVDTLVVGAGRDLLTPVSHSREIAERLPGARYVEVPDAGHMVLLERHEVVTAHLRAQLDRVRAGATAGARGASR
ncbi:MAG TPA: alpha/beta hydrolase [Jiangellales bacterium]|nr:alpha/beta hydrolase [Jiangellales bacterium]